MKNYFLISVKNSIRSFAFRLYSYYERHFKHKISVYDLQAISLIRRLPTDAVCVDIGVNEGQLFNSMYRHCKNGVLYGFEPIPDLYNYLTRKYNSPRVHLKKMVLSDTEEAVSFFYFPKRTGVSGLARRSFNQLEAKELNYTAALLDDVLKDVPRIDLVKIDVEGAELKVFRGARQTIARCRPTIIFECGYGGLEYFKGTPEEVYDFFESIGYALSIQKAYLENHPPLDRHTFLHVFKNGYESQYIAGPRA